MPESLGRRTAPACKTALHRIPPYQDRWLFGLRGVITAFRWPAAEGRMREHSEYPRGQAIANSSFRALSHAEFVKPVVVYPEVMAKFMQHCLANLFADLVVI